MPKLPLSLWSAALCLLAAFPLAAQDFDHEELRPDNFEYRSPYSVNFSFPKEELLFDILKGHRGELKEESSVPYEHWNSQAVRERYGAWGPPARHYRPPELAEGKPAEWRRERVIAVAMRFIGRPYRHHHIPDWTPPAGWPLGKLEREGCGIDCSNFTSFVYSMALGLKPDSDIKRQSEELRIPVGEREGHLEARRIERLESYEAFSKELKTADLLFIKSKGQVVHVVLWVGRIGASPDGPPLVLDSTGGNRKDSNGVFIPNGVHLRPFTEGSWYFKEASHALRLIHGE